MKSQNLFLAKLLVGCFFARVKIHFSNQHKITVFVIGPRYKFCDTAWWIKSFGKTRKTLFNGYSSMK